MTDDNEQSRRQFLLVTAAVAMTLGDSNLAFGQELSPTPQCKDGDEPTVRQTEGPFFKPRSPQRVDLREPAARAARSNWRGLC